MPFGVVGRPWHAAAPSRLELQPTSRDGSRSWLLFACGAVS
jgi:hypothetical protein